MSVLSACADPDTDVWTKWLEQALGLNPDLNMLSDSGGDRFATIDIKMAMGVQNMPKQTKPKTYSSMPHDTLNYDNNKG